MVAAPPFVYFDCENTLSFAGLSQLGLQVPNFFLGPRKLENKFDFAEGAWAGHYLRKKKEIKSKSKRRIERR